MKLGFVVNRETGQVQPSESGVWLSRLKGTHLAILHFAAGVSPAIPELGKPVFIVQADKLSDQLLVCSPMHDNDMKVVTDPMAYERAVTTGKINLYHVDMAIISVIEQRNLIALGEIADTTVGESIPGEIAESGN